MRPDVVLQLKELIKETASHPHGYGTFTSYECLY